MGETVGLVLLLGAAVFCYEIVMVLVGYTADFLAQVLPKEGIAWSQQYYLWDTVGCAWLLGIYGLWVFCLKEQRRSKEQSGQESQMKKAEGKDVKGPSRWTKQTEDERVKEQPVWKRALEVAVITFGLGGISSLWLNFAEEVLYKVPFIRDSMERFQTVGKEQLEEPYIWVFLSVVLVGPIVEELLLRGIVYQYLAEIREGWFAVIGSGLLFGLWHQEPVQVVYTMIMGVGIAIVYQKTGSLRYVIGLHILNNFLSVLPPFLETETIINGISLMHYVMILPGVYLLGRFADRRQKPEVSAESRKS